MATYFATCLHVLQPFTALVIAVIIDPYRRTLMKNFAIGDLQFERFVIRLNRVGIKIVCKQCTRYPSTQLNILSFFI